MMIIVFILCNRAPRLRCNLGVIIIIRLRDTVSGGALDLDLDALLIMNGLLDSDPIYEC
jgi:hypothetical protein